MEAAGSRGARPDPELGRQLYLDLLKRSLTRIASPEPYAPLHPRPNTVGWWANRAVQRLASQRGLELVRRHDEAARSEGRDWPAQAETMIGLRRLDSLQWCIEDALRRGVEGDLIETGVWRGGAVILMRAVLKAYGDTGRTVWAADSFQGLPKPDAGRYPADRDDPHHTYETLNVPLETVKRNFAHYGLLDDKVRFLVGWFKDTLPQAPIRRLAVLRLDGDMYESTMDALVSLYPRVSVGGYVIVDDYGAVAGCKAAVDDYRREHVIAEPIQRIDWTGVYWRRE